MKIEEECFTAGLFASTFGLATWIQPRDVPCAMGMLGQFCCVVKASIAVSFRLHAQCQRPGVRHAAPFCYLREKNMALPSLSFLTPVE